MHADVISNLAGAHLYSIVGLALFLAAFALVIVWVARMDRTEIDQISRLPLDRQSISKLDGDVNDE